ncbi:MAG: Crp/Fnr family transcriptional regulator [Nitrospirota bacterium]
MGEKNSTLEKICDAFPFLRDAGKDVREDVTAHAQIARIPKGTFIFFEGDECKQLALVLSGSVRVYKPAESGREITLYRLGKGDSCVLTASCIFSRNPFPAIAYVEDDIEVAAVPSNVFRDWVNRFEVWRNYVFNLLSKRLSEVIATVEEVAFRRVDVRIAEFLLRLPRTNNDEIRMTHQDIAMELGTSREVVSRILKHFEDEKLIILSRGTITILNMGILTSKSEG